MEYEIYQIKNFELVKVENGIQKWIMFYRYSFLQEVFVVVVVVGQIVDCFKGGE